MKQRTLAALLLAGSPLLVASCGKLLGPPPHPRTDGYSALVTVKGGGAELARFRLAVRGEALRRSASDAEGSPYFVRETAASPVFEVDPAAKSYRGATPEALLAHLDQFPLGPDFNHAAEAGRRGIKEYHRESDAVFAGNACAIWRFADQPGAFNSPWTTYWMAPALDGIVLRKERGVPKGDGSEERTSVELTHIRVGADPSLFRVPEGFRREDAPPR
jgi:hypothetical protein